jgi:protein-tyrosine-phosphatase
MGTMTSVALICTANRCRSVMAHAIFVSEVEKRSLPVQVYSAGVLDFRGAPPIHDTLKTCLDHNTPSPKEDPDWITDLPVDSITRFLVMEHYHADRLVNEFGVSPDRVSLLGEFDPLGRGPEIDDPFGQSGAVYKRSYLRIRDCIVNYLDTAEEMRDTNG